MIGKTALILAIAVAGCGAAPPPVHQENRAVTAPPQNPQDFTRPPHHSPEAGCDIVLEFSSIVRGVDMETWRAMTAWAEASPLIRQVSTRTWGMEGERTVCLTTSGPEATRRAFDELHRMTPTGVRRGPLLVTTRDGQSFRTPLPER